MLRSAISARSTGCKRTMSDYSSLFSAAAFKSTIRKYCDQYGWAIEEINDGLAKIKFEMDSGRTQTLFIIRYDTTLEFSVDSVQSFQSEDEVSHRLSTLLLKKNAEKKVGFWCLEEIDGELAFSIMHNQEISLLNAEYFGVIVRILVRECDEFETAVESM